MNIRANSTAWEYRFRDYPTRSRNMGYRWWKLAIWLGPQDDETSIATIHRALDLGINWIDTAAVYGLGHSEEIVAKALQGRSTRPYVFTKGSRVWNDKGEITSSLKEQSL